MFVIAQTDLVPTVPGTLAKIAAPLARLRVVKAPRELKPFPYFMSWHPCLTNEPALAWGRILARGIRVR